ncbi:hypothetical protein PIIN_05752 [Serendipita indica DSM 11827]|uniref:Uncharacterized protein n=1 Tax=Serendipita indica (strain DSM 11827) TaxID=1109443 RepID=G4TKH4_SERID|nr:hypothetical protein PIIN_05752 [Serendipita indica DSM 11827]
MTQPLQPHKNTNLPFPSSVLADKLPKIAGDGPSAHVGAFSTIQKRATKRTRGFSDDEDDARSPKDTSMIGREWRASTRHSAAAQTNKRVHISGREWSDVLLALRSTSVVEPSSDEEPVSSSQISAQPQEKQQTSEYAQINQMLKSLHLGRAQHKSTLQIPQEVPHAMRRMDTSKAVQSRSGAPTSGRPQVGLVEKDTVTRLYEEANRALGRLAISRRPHIPQQEVSDEVSSDDE